MKMQQNSINFKAGFVAIIGKPNVGKSTLLNQIMKEKIAIVSSKPQTTRDRISAILSTDDYQIVFIDTPGIHKPKNLLGQYMVKSAKLGLEDVDVIVFLIDAVTSIDEDDKQIFNILKNEKRGKKILCINKIDAIAKPQILPLIDQARSILSFDEYIPISALENDNIDLLLKKIVAFLPESAAPFPQEQLSTMPERFHIKEFIREKILENTREEIPYSVAVTIEEFREDKEKNLIYIKAIIWVERQSQKAIIIGKGAQMLKRIGTSARLEIERFLNCKVYLELWVKVYEHWRKDERALKKLGYC